MKVVVCERYGPPEVLRFREVPKPSPKDGEVLIRTIAASVSAGDWRVRSRIMPRGFGVLSQLFLGFGKPRTAVLGTELAGEVESVGRGVRRFQPGDQVVAFGGVSMGCYAEYKCMREDRMLARKPSTLSHEQAAALSFGGTTALHFLRAASLHHGERVLINGASGSVGSAAIQLARHFGAEVTAVCSAANRELVLSLGANHVIDYTHDDFTKNGETYDVILDTAGTAPFARSRFSLRDGGRLLLVLGTLADLLTAPFHSRTSGKRVIAGPAPERSEDLQFLAELAETGAFTPFIDRSYPFDRIVEAHRYLDTGRKRGNVVLTF